MAQLTPHFSFEELTFSSTAQRLGISNDPPVAIVVNLHVLAAGLEQVRALLGNIPLHIDSGYRCPALNAAVHGVPNSAHLDGFAADFICPAFGDPETIVQAIAASPLEFDQCIVECNSWVHISFAPAMRRQLLNARLVNGQMAYSQRGAA